VRRRNAFGFPVEDYDQTVRDRWLGATDKPL